MKINMKSIKVILMSLGAALLVSACGTTETVPMTGRKHKVNQSAYSDANMLSLGTQEYTKFMKTAKKSTNAANTAMVQRVGTRLSKAVTNYLVNNGYAAEANNFKWEFNLVQSKEANAWCLPGGKICVYEGLLPYTQNETALAIVLGHEIAHAVAKHSAEQMTKQYNQQVGMTLGGAVLGQVVGSDVATIAQQIASGAFQLKNLKYSRDDESEADHMGLNFAAMAGYNPQEAITFWQRMSKASAGNQTAEFLSDHPSDATRIAALQQEMPEAQKYYQAYLAANKKTTTTTKKTTTRRSSTRKATRKKRK